MSSPDVAKWELEFSFRDEDRCKKFIKRLLQLHYIIPFSYFNVYDDRGNRYYVNIEENSANSLMVVAKLLSKVDYKYED